MDSKTALKTAARRCGLCTIFSAVLFALAPISAQAIGSVSDGGVTFEYTSFFSGTNNTANTNFTGAATGDQTFESWWFFRVSGSSQESAFAAPDAESYNGAVAQLDWADPSGLNLFSANLGVEVLETAAGTGNLFQAMNITNTSGVDLTIDIFHYSDLEIAGSNTADSATLGSHPNGIAVDIADGSDTTPIIGYGADAFQVSDWFSPNSVLRGLTDSDVDNLDGSGLPFSGDFTIAFQWSSRTIGAGETEMFLTQFGSNSALLNPNVSQVPEPGTALLLGIGLFAMAGWRRRTG